MAKTKTVFVCRECGTTHPRWLGRCPDCETWDSLQEERIGGAPTRSPGPASAARAIPLPDVEPEAETRLTTGLGELDRVLGGGLVPGSGVLIAGEPGIGKSTLLLQSAQAMAAHGHRFLYISGEESASQVKLRADRLGETSRDLFLLPECDLDAIENEIFSMKPAVVGIDSVQMLRWQEIPSAAGGVLQVREVTARLLTLARNLGFPLLLIGHVTKEGSIAGPRVLEHLVDGVLTFEGERTGGLRVLRATKNRFGSTQEVGLFEMQSQGLQEVPDASRLLLGTRRRAAPGSATAAILEGNRPLLVEIQALVTASSFGSPARKVSGLDSGRLSMLAAVLEKRLGIPLGDHDIHANVVGGVRINTHCADLALAAALISSIRDQSFPAEWIFSGEVGLLGEVRAVPEPSRRLEEAARLGFRAACLPPESGAVNTMDLQFIEIPDLAALANLL